jgi:hypothetical protein
MADIVDGILIGGAGGAIAGITVSAVRFLGSAYADWRDKRRVYKWLMGHTSNEPGEQFRSTRAIASWNNLTEDRVRFICSVHKKVFLSTGKKEDMWGIHDREPRSVYEKRGAPVI